MIVKMSTNQDLEKEFIKIIENDIWMLNILKVVRDLKLNDCWIGAGFVRNKIWDVKHKKSRTKLNDIDVIYFDKSNISETYDLQLENKLRNKGNYNWSVKNQARMHIRNQQKSYNNSLDAISYWPETATALAVRLNNIDKIKYIAPYQLKDLFNLIVRPTPNFDIKTYKKRMEKKKWNVEWPKLKIEKVD